MKVAHFRLLTVYQVSLKLNANEHMSTLVLNVAATTTTTTTFATVTPTIMTTSQSMTTMMANG